MKRSTALRQATHKTWRNEQLNGHLSRAGKAKLMEDIPFHQHTPTDE